MGDVDALGLLKMDFLGLRNLDVIDKAVELIGNGLDITKIPMDDRKTYEMLASADSIGVFQFESSGMRDALRQVKPTEFDDLIALVALYRPGPMAYIPEYASGRTASSRSRTSTRASSRSPVTPTASASTRSSTSTSPRARRLHARRGRRLAQGDRQEDPRAHGVPQGQVPRGLRGLEDDTGGREAALEGHGAVAGLLLQQGALGLLRADRPTAPPG